MLLIFWVYLNDKTEYSIRFLLLLDNIFVFTLSTTL